MIKQRNYVYFVEIILKFDFSLCILVQLNKESFLLNNK